MKKSLIQALAVILLLTGLYLIGSTIFQAVKGEVTSLVTPSSTPAPEYHFEQFTGNKGHDLFNETCKEKADWVTKSLVTSATTSWESFKNPTNVTMIVRPVVIFGGYYTNINSNGTFSVFKDGIEVIGEEREAAVRDALKSIDGITHLKLTYTLERKGFLFEVTNVSCTIP